MSPRSYAALLLDFAVLHRDDSARRIAALERRYGLPEGTLDRAVREPRRRESALRGEITDEEWRLAVAADLVPHCGVGAAAEIVAAWSEPPGRLSSAVLTLVRVARDGGTPVVLVADATTRLEFDLVRLGLHEEVDAVVSSARVGAVQPDEVIFQAAVDAAEISAGECLFIDTDPDHVAAARRLGLQAVRFTGPRALRTRLGLTG